MAEKVYANYGLIHLSRKTNMEFYVFDKEVDVISGKFSIQQKLSDGRYAIGGIYFSGLGDKIARRLKLKKGGLEIKTEQELKLRKPLDKETKEKIKDELLTTRCDICNKPTQYKINFTTFRDPFGGGMGYIKHACEEHINEITEKEGKPWEVIKTESFYGFDGGKILGRVKYNTDKKEFIPCPSIIDDSADFQPLKSSCSINGKLVYRFNQDTGILEIGDEKMAEQIKEGVSGDLWKGVNLEFILPFVSKPIKLSGVKEIKSPRT